MFYEVYTLLMSKFRDTLPKKTLFVAGSGDNWVKSSLLTSSPRTRAKNRRLSCGKVSTFQHCVSLKIVINKSPAVHDSWYTYIYLHRTHLYVLRVNRDLSVLSVSCIAHNNKWNGYGSKLTAILLMINFKLPVFHITKSAWVSLGLTTWSLFENSLKTLSEIIGEEGVENWIEHR